MQKILFTNLSLVRNISFRGVSVKVRHLDGLRDSIVSALALHLKSLRSDAVLLHYPPCRLVWWLCALRWLTIPWNPRLILADELFEKPRNGAKGCIVAMLMRFLWKRVDLFINHMKDVDQLQLYYGISKARCRFAEFKINPSVRARLAAGPTSGQYVFSGGRSRRDFSTFCLAMKGLPWPGLIVMPRQSEASYHDTYLDESIVPGNVQVSWGPIPRDSWMESMNGAKLVVVVINKDCINSSGTSVYLEAMGLGKCVIATECPGTRGILTDGEQAILVRGGDPEALRRAIYRAWEDELLRTRIAETGLAYAIRLGDETAMVQRFVDGVLDHFGWITERDGS
jgi:glycosyltransferase involved in cell wall biosynthesis